jgi:hypothetical protein
MKLLNRILIVITLVCYLCINVTIVFQRKAAEGEIAQIEIDNRFFPRIPPMPTHTILYSPLRPPHSIGQQAIRIKASAIN